MPTKKKRINIIPDNLPALTDPEQVCPSVFTANKLSEDPVKYGQVVQALGEGKPLTRIAKEYRIAPETVTAVMKREKESIDAVQTMTAGLTSYASQACLMTIIDKLHKDEMPAGVLPICFGILRDKERADLGQATQTIEVRKTLSIEDVRVELEEMKREAVDVEVEDL